MKYELMLPLPPSINTVYVFNKYIHQKVYKRSATSYLTLNEEVVRKWIKEHQFPMRTDYFYLDMYFWMPRSNADSHNYKKIMLDVLEHAGLVINDKFIMDRTQDIKVDKENPRCRMIISI